MSLDSDIRSAFSVALRVLLACCRIESLRNQHRLHPNDNCEIEREIHSASDAKRMT